MGTTVDCHAKSEKLTILHTNDWQSRFLGFGPNADYSPSSMNDDDTIGGISRLASLIEQRRKVLGEENLLLLDGGDYSMGTLFHTIIRETGSELQLMAALGYDAITLGNHEFDYGPDALARSINAAMKVADIPPIVISNMIFSDQDTADDSLQELVQQGVIKPYVVLVKGQQKVGIFGLMGRDAIDVVSNGKPLSFNDPVATAERMVKLLRQQEKVDTVIVLSHGGVHKDIESTLGWKGDDVDLLSKVKGIDIIVGGHSHTPLHDPLFIDERIIVQAGSEAQYLGELSLDIESKKISKVDYDLHPINDSILGKAEIIEKIEIFKQQVTSKFLQPSGYSFDQILARSQSHLGRKYEDLVIANLVTDSLRKITNADFAITANGSIRDDIYFGSNGLQRVSDLFRVVPLGPGLINDNPGHEILKVWITGSEIKNILEVLLLAQQKRGQSFYPRFSGLEVTYNTARMSFDQISQIRIGNPENGFVDLDTSTANQRLYSMALNTYVGSFIGLINKISYGLLDIKPKTREGEPIHQLQYAVYDSDKSQNGTQAVKEWQGFFRHVESLTDNDNDGIVDLPTSSDQRLIKIHSYGAADLFNNATWITYLSMLMISLVVCILVFVMRRFFSKSQIKHSSDNE